MYLTDLLTDRSKCLLWLWLQDSLVGILIDSVWESLHWFPCILYIFCQVWQWWADRMIWQVLLSRCVLRTFSCISQFATELSFFFKRRSLCNTLDIFQIGQLASARQTKTLCLI